MVKHVEKYLVLVVCQVDAEITEGFHGLSVGEVSTSVNVGNSESSTDTSNSTGATLGQLSAELDEDFVVVHLSGGLRSVVNVVLGKVSNDGFVAISNSIKILRDGAAESSLLGHQGGVKSFLFIVSSGRSTLTNLRGWRARLGLHAAILSDVLSVISTSSSSDFSTLGSPGISGLTGSI